MPGMVSQLESARKQQATDRSNAALVKNTNKVASVQSNNNAKPAASKPAASKPASKSAPKAADKPIQKTAKSSKQAVSKKN
jgi:hypothetical protein